MSEPYTPREFILEPWLRVKDLVMIYATRGTGKTWISLGIALGVASGKPFLKWTTLKPRKVLLVDGEMPIETLQERSAALCKGGGYNPEGRLRIIAALLQEGSYPNISTPEGQKAIEAHIQDEELVILDNLSCLAGSAVENEAEGWEPIQGWLLGLRKRGVAVIFVHHAGKNNDQRGTSKREDVLDTTIQLKRPRDYDPKEGARFEVHFTKARGLIGSAVEPFETRIQVRQEGGVSWATRDMGDLMTDRIIELQGTGMSQRDIATEVGLDVANVSRRLKAAREDGRLPIKVVK